MRDVAVTEGDKVEAQLRLGVSVNTYGVNDLVAAVDGAPLRRPSTRSSADYEASYSVVPELATGGARHESLRYAARIEAGLRSFLDGGRLRPPSRRTSRTSADCDSSPASPCSASWPTATASAPRATGRPRRSCGS